MLDDLFVASRCLNGYSFSGDFISRPENINVPVHILAKLLKVGVEVELRTVSPIRTWTENQLGIGLLFPQSFQDGVHNPGVIRRSLLRAFATPTGIIHTDAEPFDTLALSPGIMLKEKVNVFGLCAIQGTLGSQLRIHAEAKSDSMLAAGTDDIGKRRLL